MNTVVIGVVFLDVKGFPLSAYDAAGTNLGDVVLEHGGVARNIAENLANLGARVSFVSMFDEGPLGAAARARLTEAGVSLECAVETREKGMGMWLAVFDSHGDLAGSISRMPDAGPLEKLFEEKGDEIVSGARDVLLELDISEALSERVLALAEKYQKNVYAIAANMRVVLRRPDLLSHTACAVFNEIEAERLFGASLRGLAPEEFLKRAREGAERLGLKALIVTMGARGAAYVDIPRRVSGYCPAVPANVVDTTGAGDAFFSAAVEALSRGMPLDKAVERGARLASMTIATSQSTCPRVGEAFFSME